MFNVITESSGTPGAVLVRALDPLEGIEAMQSNRGEVDPDDLTNGPGKLTQALRIGKDQNGEDLVQSDELWLSEGKPIDEHEIETSGRIGVSQGKEEQLRFFLTNNGFVSQ